MHTDRNVQNGSEGLRRSVGSERDSRSADSEGKDVNWRRRQYLLFAMCSIWYAKGCIQVGRSEVKIQERDKNWRKN